MVVLADGERVEVENTEELRAEVLSVAAKIREHRRNIEREIPVQATGRRSAERAASGQTAVRLAPECEKTVSSSSSVIVRRHRFGEALISMSDKKERFRGENYRRQRSQELKAGFPVPEFPEGSKHKHQDSRISLCVLPSAARRNRREISEDVNAR